MLVVFNILYILDIQRRKLADRTQHAAYFSLATFDEVVCLNGMLAFTPEYP